MYTVIMKSSTSEDLDKLLVTVCVCHGHQAIDILHVIIYTDLFSKSESNSCPVTL
jgi:hypothetical protein